MGNTLGYIFNLNMKHAGRHARTVEPPESRPRPLVGYLLSKHSSLDVSCQLRVESLRLGLLSSGVVTVSVSGDPFLMKMGAEPFLRRTSCFWEAVWLQVSLSVRHHWACIS